jgi:general secretion pathway protein C
MTTKAKRSVLPALPGGPTFANATPSALAICLVLLVGALAVLLSRDTALKPGAVPAASMTTVSLPLPRQQLTPGWRQPRAGMVASAPSDDRAAGIPPTAGGDAVQLDLTLRGTFVSGDPATAHAIIADSSGREMRYKIGDTIAAGVELDAVMADRVILRRGDRNEELLFWSAGYEPGGARSEANAGSLAVSAKPRFRKNPKSMVDYVDAEPVYDDGQFFGFRLKPRQKSYPLKTFGLRQGDVVTWVNDVDLDNPMKGIRALRALSSGDYVSMTVRRNGQDLALAFHVPQ